MFVWLSVQVLKNETYIIKIIYFCKNFFFIEFIKYHYQFVREFPKNDKMLLHLVDIVNAHCNNKIYILLLEMSFSKKG